MIHHIGPRGSPMLLALLRSGAGVTLVGLIGWNTGWSVMKTAQLPLQLLRGFVSVRYLWVLMYSLCPNAVRGRNGDCPTLRRLTSQYSLRSFLNERITTSPMDCNCCSALLAPF